MVRVLIVVVFFCLPAITGNGQIRIHSNEKLHLLSAPVFLKKNYSEYWGARWISPFKTEKISLLRNDLKPDFSTKNLPFFCRQELKAEKSFGFPVRLRVGNVEYTDWLEQKPNTSAPR